MQAKFITLEGTEGAGKSTALSFIQTFLQQAGIQFTVTREPGGTEIAEAIRQVLLFPATNEVMQPITELLLMFASRAQLINQIIKPTLAKGEWVLSDRFVDASYAYQGGGRALPLSEVALLDQLVVKSLTPDLTLLLDIPVELGLARTKKRGEHDRIEAEAIAFFERVRECYLERAKHDPDRIKIVDASQPVALVNEQIKTILQSFLERGAA